MSTKSTEMIAGNLYKRNIKREVKGLGLNLEI